MKFSAKILSFVMVLMMAFGALSIFAMMPNEAHASEASATMKYSSSTTTNMTGGNDASKVGLPSIFTVIASKGGSNNFPGLNKNGTIRLYYASGNNGNEIEVKISSDYIIDSVVINIASTGKANCQLTVGKTSTSVTSGASMDINATSFIVKNVHSSNTQLHISSIVINYSSASDDCEHANTTTNRVEATCTTAGHETVTCDDCGKEVSRTAR